VVVVEVVGRVQLEDRTILAVVDLVVQELRTREAWAALAAAAVCGRTRTRPPAVIVKISVMSKPTSPNSAFCERSVS
jgi:hypothetical protein